MREIRKGIMFNSPLEMYVWLLEFFETFDFKMIIKEEIIFKNHFSGVIYFKYINNMQKNDI